MRNLKRILSLAISAIMLVSMMAIGASAVDFTDADEIDNLDAVNMLVALNVINGMDDGSFDPEGSVTRAQMAKMIYIAMNGGKDTSLVGFGLQFDDVSADHWAVGYIDWCANMGIISGDENGNFNPDDEVTGTQAAKMILIAIGYDSGNSGFTGDSWAINVNVQADTKDLWDDVDVNNTSLAISRQNAAQMIVNGLEADMVWYDYKLTTVDGVLTSLPVVTDYTYNLLEKKFNLSTSYGYMTGVFYDEDDAEFSYDIERTLGLLDIANIYDDTDDLVSANGVSYDLEADYSYLFGMQVKVLTDSDSGDLYGMFSVDSSVMASGVIDDIDDADASDDEITIDDVDYDLSYTVATTSAVYIYNGEVATLDDLSALEVYYQFELIDNDGDNDADLMIVYPYSAEEVTYVGTTSVTLANIFDDYTSTGNIKYEDENIDESIEEDDVVMVIDGKYTVDGKIAVLPMDVVSGEVVSSKTGALYKVDGVWYEYLGGDDDSLDLGEEYDLYVVGTFIFADTMTSEGTPDDLLFITNWNEGDNGSWDTAEAEVYFMDGTSEIIVIAEVDDDDDIALPHDGNGNVDAFYTYEIDDGEYYLYTAGSLEDDGDMITSDYDYFWDDGAGYTESNTRINGYYIDDDAVIIIQDKDDYDVYTGAKVSDWDSDFGTGSIIFYDDVDGMDIVKVAYIYDTDAYVPGSAGDDTYGYIISDPERVYVAADDEYYMSYTIWTAYGAIDVLADDSTKDVNKVSIEEGQFIYYDDLGDGYIEDVVVLDALDYGDLFVSGTTAGYFAVTGLSSSAIKLTTLDIDGSFTGAYDLTDDTIYIYVDADDVAGVDGGKVALGDKQADGTYTMNVMAVINTDDEVEILFVEVGNDMFPDDDIYSATP